MSSKFRPCLLASTIACSLLAMSATAAFAQDAVELETVEVTSAKIPVNLRDSTQTTTVVSGDDLRARGATDLRTALSLVAGVDIAPGGGDGPASAVPALWGSREFAACLLFVDGAPRGAEVSPALPPLSPTTVHPLEAVTGAGPAFLLRLLCAASGAGNHGGGSTASPRPVAVTVSMPRPFPALVRKTISLSSNR